MKDEAAGGFRQSSDIISPFTLCSTSNIPKPGTGRSYGLWWLEIQGDRRPSEKVQSCDSGMERGHLSAIVGPSVLAEKVRWLPRVTLEHALPRHRRLLRSCVSVPSPPGGRARGQSLHRQRLVQGHACWLCSACQRLAARDFLDSRCRHRR